jgi:tRNA threonylcarbamoyladenosine modification (KEOPS) complex  Pcc1 subunit
VLCVLRVQVDIKLSSVRVATALWKALLPESLVSLRGVKVSLKQDNSLVRIVVEAGDESSLRAAVNSFIKLSYLILEVLSAW